MILNRPRSLIIQLNTLKKSYLALLEKLPKSHSKSQHQRLSHTQQQTSTDIAYLKNLLTENKTRNFLVYSCKSSGSAAVNLIGILGSCFLLVVSYNSWFIFGSTKFQETSSRREGSGWFTTILRTIGSEYFKYAACGVTALVAVVIFIGSLAVTSRTVNKMYLLKGGKSLGLVTDGVFGRNMTFTLNLEETSFNQIRIRPDKRESQIWFKNKRHFFYFGLNNVDGEFHEKLLFDRVICAVRDNW